MNAICKVIIKKILRKIYGLWFHEMTHICKIYFLNTASLANQEMFCVVSLKVSVTIKTNATWTKMVLTPWSLVRISP